MTLFDGAVPALSAALTKRGYEKLTPVQSSVLEPEAADIDLLVSAQTGSGKTVAFGLAMASTLLEGAERFPRAEAPLALVIAPTRELALQVKRELEWLYEETGAKTVSCVGGMEMRVERRALSGGAHIVVGTPGRLRDHIERGSLDLSSLRVVILDEADEMLDLGFREDLEFILDAAPETRRTLMFSATVPRPIAMLAKRYQRDALRISTVEDREPHGDIEYRAYATAPADRENVIINVLRYYEAQNSIVFCGTREMVKRLTSRLANRGFSVVALSGELSQNERSHALQAMRDGRARVCVATDVAARGIDLPNLDLVIHADLPTGKATMLHRSGRTGRAGRKGVSALVVPYTRRRAAERLIGSAGLSAEWAAPPTTTEIVARDRERLLADPMLTRAPDEGELESARELLEKFSAEQIAAAYLRDQQARHPVPEELIEVSPSQLQSSSSYSADGPRKERRDFEGGVWFKVSLGRKHRAEPRWLLPMICRAGHVTKRDVGSIRIVENETRFEIAPQHAKRFIETIETNGTGEKSVTITRFDGDPNDDAGGRRGAGRKGYGRSGGDPGERSRGASSGPSGGKTARFAGKKPFKREGGGEGGYKGSRSKDAGSVDAGPNRGSTSKGKRKPS